MAGHDVDFKTIAPIRFGFASEPADQARRIASYSLKRSRRRMAMLAEAPHCFDVSSHPERVSTMELAHGKAKT
jgi:hypothetical protein